MNAEDAQLLKSYWPSVVKELNNMIEKELCALRVCKGEDLAAHQERIKVYEGLKSLPDDVLARQGIQA